MSTADLSREITTETDLESVLAALLLERTGIDMLDIATVETIREADSVDAPGLIVTTETGFTFVVSIQRHTP